MGGKNPPWVHGPKELRELSQKQSRLLFLCASKFYEAHAKIEDAVLAETTKKVGVLKLFGRAIYIFQEIEVITTENLDLLMLCADRFSSSNSWTVYLKKQQLIFQKLAKSTAVILEDLCSPSVNESIESSSFQWSMLYEGENSRIRYRSMEFSKLIIKSLTLHDEFVERENAMLQKFSAA